LNQPSQKSLLPHITAALLFIASFTAAAFTIPNYGITWDEPGYVEQAKRMRSWFTLLLREPLSAVKNDSIKERWPVWEGGQPKRPGDESIQDRLNPPLAIALGGLSASIFERILGTFNAHRLLGALSYALIVSLLYFWINKEAGHWAGLASAVTFGLMPRIFGHAHFFATDLPATALTLLSAFSLMAYPDSRRWKLAGGVFLGLAAATKFTALMLPLPIIMCALMRKDRKLILYALIAALIAAPVMVAVNPGLWHHAIGRIRLYFILSTERSRFIAIPTYYFGRVYWFRLPWHHPWVMALGTVPFLSAILALIGCARVVSRAEKSPDALFMLTAFLALMATFMTPMSPGHDGERLFMLAFPFMAALAGFGFKWIVERLRGPRAKSVALALLTLPGAFGIIEWHPYELSFYGLLVGGAGGAHRLGLETTYWIDALTPHNEAEVRRIIAGSPQTFAPYFEQPLSWRAQTGRLGEGATITGDNPHWTLLIGRQGMMDDLARLAWEFGSPKWEARRDGVRLVGLFETVHIYDGIAERLNALDGQETNTSYLKGLLAEAKGNYPAALEDYETALKLNPDQDRAALHLCRVLSALGRYDKAIVIGRFLVKKDPSAENYMELGDIYNAMGDKQNAIQAYRRVLEIHLNYPDALKRMMDIQNVR